MGKKGPGWSSTLPCKVIKSKIYQLFQESVFRWFNSKNNSKKNSNLLPSLKECLFGLSENSPNNSCRTAKLNYTLLFMRFYECFVMKLTRINFILVNFITKHLHVLSQTLPNKQKLNTSQKNSFLIPYYVRGCKENHFYSLPFGQAEASIYQPRRHFNQPQKLFDQQN